MSSINLVFPHQLFEHSPLLENGYPIVMVEEWLFFRQFAFHKQKLVFHRITMQAYARYLRAKGAEVNYVESGQATSDIRRLIPEMGIRGCGASITLTPPTIG